MKASKMMIIAAMLLALVVAVDGIRTCAGQWRYCTRTHCCDGTYCNHIKRCIPNGYGKDSTSAEFDREFVDLIKDAVEKW